MDASTNTGNLFRFSSTLLLDSAQVQKSQFIVLWRHNVVLSISFQRTWKRIISYIHILQTQLESEGKRGGKIISSIDPWYFHWAVYLKRGKPLPAHGATEREFDFLGEIAENLDIYCSWWDESFRVQFFFNSWFHLLFIGGGVLIFSFCLNII